MFLTLLQILHMCVRARMQMCVRPCRLIYILSVSLSCLRMNYFSVILLVFPLPLLSLSTLLSPPLSLPAVPILFLFLPYLLLSLPHVAPASNSTDPYCVCLPAPCVFKLYLCPQTFPFCSSPIVPAHHHSPVLREVTT